MAKLKIIPLGGLGEIGKNLTVYEYGQDIIVVDWAFRTRSSTALTPSYPISPICDRTRTASAA